MKMLRLPMLFLAALCGGCCFYSTNLDPKNVERLQVEAVERDGHVVLRFRGFVLSAALGPTQLKTTVEGTTLRVSSVVMKLRERPELDLELMVDDEIDNVSWGGSNVWTRCHTGMEVK